MYGTFGDNTAITPGATTLYRVFLLGRELCATNNASLACWAEAEAKRHLSRRYARAANDMAVAA